MSNQRSAKPRVAIIGTRGYPSYYGGFETAVRRLAPYLADRGWDVIVYGRPGATRDSDPSLDPRIIRKETSGLETKSLSTLSYGLTACLHASRTKPDVALVMNVANGFWLPILRLRGIPTLVNVDGIEWDRAKWGRFAKLVFRTGAKLTARFGTRLVFDARAIAARWQTDFGREGIFIPYGGEIAEELPAEDGLTHRGYVLVVARFVPENTIPEFLEAAEVLCRSWPVVIVGSSGYGGVLEDKIRALALHSENIRWLGHISDDRRLLSLWQHAGVYFHGHSVGGTNPALVQAMACGAPTVARDTVYNREVLGTAGAFVVPNVASIVEMTRKLMSDSSLQTEFSEAARLRAEAFYSWDAISRDYEESLIRLLHK
ncbi:glycosyltransferase [Cryobacterium cheniae]|uniref:Glycosyltransferase n=1 Tax=Cryobacterium cheniae TaxID=1259262 RepID=A0A4R8XUA7_9MICO|nr:glycosyltransferase [Cryobacterium cheniae]